MSGELQPEMMRAFARDEDFKSHLCFKLVETLEVFVNYRLLSKWDEELKVVAELIYFAFTTLRSKPTLGEEYCEIR